MLSSTSIDIRAGGGGGVCYFNNVLSYQHGIINVNIQKLCTNTTSSKTHVTKLQQAQNNFPERSLY